MRTQPQADHDSLTFRGATLDEAIEAAEAELGPRVRVLSANHIRRGGIGGFFASDLGVEIAVAVEEETAEEALGRIVEETATQERERWRERIEGAVEPVTTTERPTFAETMQRVDPQPKSTHPSARPDAIVPALDLPHLPPVHPVTASVLPSVLPAAMTPAAMTPAVPVNTTVPATSVSAPAPAASSSSERMARLEAAFAALRDQVGATSVGSAPVRGAGAPSRRQVELAVAAAEQMIDGVVARHTGTDRLSVRVMMRSAHGSEIEIHAQWSAAEEVV